LDGDDGYLFEVRNRTGGSALFSSGAGSPYALNTTRAAGLAKDKAFCAIALQEAGVPTPPGKMFFVKERWSEMRAPGREPDDARAYARSCSYPVFCKPIAGTNGVYAEVIDDYAEFEDYLQRVAADHYAILIQPCLRGAEYRVFVLNDRVLFAYEKLPPSVIGNGASTLRDLAAALIRDNAPPVERTRGRAADGRRVELDERPPAGMRIMLEGPANLAAGGQSCAPIDAAPAPLAALGLAAASALGLKIAGVDIFDLSAERDFSDLCIIEVNSNPMIKTLEQHGRWDLIETIWRANFAAALK